jgi:hypothetical protein
MLLPLGIILTVSTVFFLVLAVLDLLGVLPRLDPATAAGQQHSCPFWLPDSYFLRRAPVRIWPPALSTHVRTSSSATCALPASLPSMGAASEYIFGV